MSFLEFHCARNPRLVIGQECGADVTRVLSRIFCLGGGGGGGSLGEGKKN